MRRAALVAALLSLLATVGLGALVQTASAAGGSVHKTALLDADASYPQPSLTDGSGNHISLEQYAAERAGYTVTVVPGATWNTMSAADFAKYQLLIIGDDYANDDCTASPDPLSNISTWGPVVMGTSGLNALAGNRVVVGTDPADHFQNGAGGAQPTTPGDPSTAGAEHLVQSGLTYAGSVDGATGVYYSIACFEPGASDDAALNTLSTTGTGFTDDIFPPCGGSVSLIATNPAFATLTDSDLQGWDCSDHITRPTYPTDWQPLAVATDTSSQPTCGTDPDTGAKTCGEAYVLVAGSNIVVTAPDLTLTPATSSDPAGGTHTVTATVKSSGSPLPGVPVSFEVTGQNAGVSGTCAPASCITPASGQVTFTYADSNGPGTDTINASITVSGTTEHATASETWQPPIVTPPSGQPKLDDLSLGYESLSSPGVYTHGVTTSAPNELLLAFVEADGATGHGETVTSVVGAGVTWHRTSYIDLTGDGSTEVWQAYSTAKITAGTVIAKFSSPAAGAISVETFTGAAHQLGRVAVSSTGGGPARTVIDPLKSNSLIVAGAIDRTSAAKPVPVAGQSLISYLLDYSVGNSYWTQDVAAPTSAGVPVTVKAALPGTDRWSMVAVEVPPAS